MCWTTKHANRLPEATWLQVHPGGARGKRLLLDKLGFEVRTGHHCAQPLMNRYGVQGMVRASFAAYNTLDEVHRFVEAVRRVSTMF